jgi:hypothetical protein
MTPKEKLFLSKLLEMAAEHYGNHICNDLPKSLCDHFSENEWKDLFLKFHQFNEHTDEPKESHPIYMDCAWMDYFAHILKQEAK